MNRKEYDDLYKTISDNIELMKEYENKNDYFSVSYLFGHSKGVVLGLYTAGVLTDEQNEELNKIINNPHSNYARMYKENLFEKLLSNIKRSF